MFKRLSLTRRALLLGVSALSLTRVKAGSFSMIQVGNPNAAINQITSQNLPIGGVGASRGMFMANDGTMFVRNDSSGPHKGNTSAIPASGTFKWTTALNQNNLPSGWMTSPSPYLGANVFGFASAPNNSNIVYMMFCAIDGKSLTVLMKSTDGCNTWSLVSSYPTNSASGNGGQPQNNSESIAIDPNNSNIAWVSDNAQLRVTLDGGSTWNAVNPNGSANPAYAMAYDPTTANRLIVGIPGSGLYVSTNANLGASATFTHIAGSNANPGQARIGSDGTYYCTDSSNQNTVNRLTTGNVFSTILTLAQGVTTFAVDPNNPARVIAWQSGFAPYYCSSACNTGTPTWAGTSSGRNFTSPDSPWMATAFAGGDTFLTDGAMWFDPWTTTSTSSVNLSTLSAGGSVSFQVPAGIPNITVGRQLRATHTGTSTDYVIFNVASYSGTTLTGTIISTAQGGYLGGPIGGTATVSAWTISAERLYTSYGAGVLFMDGFTTGTQNIQSCTFGLEGSAIIDVIWPVGGNPMATTQDRAFFQFPTNPWNATAGAINGYSPSYSVTLVQSPNLAVSLADPTFWVGSDEAGAYLSTQSGKSGTFSAFSVQPTAFGGPIACANSNVIVICGRGGGTSTSMYYTQNGGTTWSLMPSPAPTSGWDLNSLFQNSHVMAVDKTSTSAPYLFYAFNSDGHIYKISVPTSGAPTVTQQPIVGGTAGQFGYGGKLDTVAGNAGHLFFSYGGVDGATNYTNVFSNHPAGGRYRLMFSPDGGATQTFLTTTQEVITFGLGAPTTGGGGYPTIYVAGWVGGGNYGIYRCINFNPASLGSETWQLITTFANDYGLSQPLTIGADPNQEQRFIVGYNGSGAAIFQNPSLANSWF